MPCLICAWLSSLLTLIRSSFVLSTASVVLVSSNPTNLVLSGAFSISFLSYAAHVVLPFLAAALCVFPLLLYMFRAPALVPRRLRGVIVHVCRVIFRLPTARDSKRQEIK